jgi:hypothetical protein
MSRKREREQDDDAAVQQAEEHQRGSDTEAAMASASAVAAAAPMPRAGPVLDAASTDITRRPLRRRRRPGSNPGPTTQQAADPKQPADPAASAEGLSDMKACGSGDVSESSPSVQCPICLEPVACAAKPPRCDHVMCRCCAYQMFHMGAGDTRFPPAVSRCPQCRDSFIEAELQPCARVDAIAARTARQTLAPPALEEWEQRRKEGLGLGKLALFPAAAKAPSASAAANVSGHAAAAAAAAGAGAFTPGGVGGGGGAAAPQSQVVVHYMASRAPTGRARCTVCKQAIEQGCLRLHGREYRKFLHPACMDFHREVSRACEAARMNTRGGGDDDEGVGGEVLCTVRADLEGEPPVRSRGY